MKKSPAGSFEFLIFIAVLGTIFLILETLGIAVNKLYVIIPFILIWIGLKNFLRNRSK